MVAVLNNDGTYYLCSDPRFYRHSALDKTLYYRKDLPSTPIDPSSPPIATGIHAGRNNIIFNMCIDSYSLNPNNILGTGANISLTPDPILFHENGTVYFSSTDECLFITDVIIDGVNFGAIGSYEFVNVTAPLPIIEVVTAHYQYEIAAIAHPNGFIDPPGIIEVNCRENITYTITPDEGYEISYVLVNGNNMGAIDTYTFNSVLSNETIEAFFNPISYSLNPNNILGTGANISLTPDPILFHENGTAYFSSTDECLFITDVIIDGVNFGAIGSYEFVNVTAPLPIIEVVTAHYQYEIAAIAHPNGFIDPPGIIEVNCRENITYTITPNEGYEISYVLVNGNNMGAIDTYTFNSVLSNETIEVFFNPKNSVNEQTIEGISIYCYMNIIYIANKNDLPINDITIFDMFGCVIWKGIPQQMQQIVLDVVNGIYTVRVATINQFLLTKISIQR